MNTIAPSPHIISADRISDALLIEFDDRKCALYTAAFLYEILSKAIEVENTEPISRPERKSSPLA
jgi:hypothetical protein